MHHLEIVPALKTTKPIAKNQKSINIQKVRSSIFYKTTFSSKFQFVEANSNYKKYIKFVEDARKRYIPCVQANCSCHLDVISKDLSIFKNGITDKLIKNIVSK